MIELLIAIVVLILVTIVPVMIAAKLLKAANTGFVSCLIAVVLSAIVNGFVSQFVAEPLLSLVINFAISALIFSAVLGAKYVQSACIALLAVVIQYGGLVLLGVFGLSLASMSSL